MKAGLSAAYSVFIIALANVSVITLLYFFVTSIPLPTVPGMAGCDRHHNSDLCSGHRCEFCWASCNRKTVRTR